MEIKEAIAELRNMRKFNYTLAPDEVFTMAISALEKQDGKKPLPISNDSTWSKCPVCGNTGIDEYCDKCGQHIDWSE